MFRSIGSVVKLKLNYKWLFYLFFTFFTTAEKANATVDELFFDIYRTNQISIKELKKNFGSTLKKISEMDTYNGAMDKNTSKLRRKIIRNIYSMGNFAYVDLAVITYPKRKYLTQITIDIVDKKDKHRLSIFLKNPRLDLPDPDQLLEKWIEYENIGIKTVFREKNFPKSKSCSFHHCLYGFDDELLMPYKHLFSKKVPKNKKKLISILQKDKDGIKRASAVFLLAHLDNPQEVINILLPSMFDSSPLVRNNVMRVLGAILMNNKLPINFPIKNVVAALDFPDSTDRGKALIMIDALVIHSKYSHYIKRKASHLLIANLKMIQISLHEPAYSILKKISGKNYSDRDYQSWEQWAKSIQ